MFWGVKRGRRLGLTTLPQHVSRLSIQFGIFNISQPYRPRLPVTGIALLFLIVTSLDFDPSLYVCGCFDVNQNVRGNQPIK
jgi:hypothetical protein